MVSANTIQPGIISDEVKPLSASIIKILLYFRIFHYPIKKDELFNFVSSDNKIEVQTVLARLIGEGLVKNEGDFIWVMEDTAGRIGNRLEGNKRAAKYLQVAKMQARFLSLFPFIKCICISGSLSKLYMDEHSDIDYFIITKHRRLWLTKLLMSVIVETLEVFGWQKYFCPNYIITENNLCIKDRNMFTAMEIITLIPLYNAKEFQRFLDANQWIKDYFPNYEKNTVVTPAKYIRFFQSFWESRFFTWADTRVFRFYQKRFAKKIKRGKIVAFENDMVITENDFKLHLSGHRKRILQKHQHNILEFENRFGVVL